MVSYPNRASYFYFYDETNALGVEHKKENNKETLSIYPLQYELINKEDLIVHFPREKLNINPESAFLFDIKGKIWEHIKVPHQPPAELKISEENIILETGHKGHRVDKRLIDIINFEKLIKEFKQGKVNEIEES